MRGFVPIVIIAVAVVVVVIRRVRGRPMLTSSLGPQLLRRVTRWWRSGDREPPLGVTGLVAGREVQQRMTGRAFRVATLLGVLGIVAGVVIPTLSSGSEHRQQIGVVGALSAAERTQLGNAARSVGTTFRFVPERDRASADADLRSDKIDVALVDGDAVLVKEAVTSDDTSTTAVLAGTLAKTLGVERALQAAGLSAAQVAELAAAQPVPIRSLSPAKPAKIVKGASITGTILVFILLSQYLSWTLIGVMQEKSNRVVEVLLAAVRPWQLLAGKLLGIGLVVLVQAAVFVGVALGAAAAVGSSALQHATPFAIVSQLIWLVLGYAFYSWLYAAAGSLVERQDQVQSLVIPLTVPLVFGYVVSLSAASSGHSSALLQVLGYLPPTAPFAMPILIALKTASWWQLVLSGLITVGCTLVIARLAAAVYRKAILRTGRRVHLREVLRAERVA